MRIFSDIDYNETRSIIISTNVAETSLTIRNIKYVIDSGKEKRKEYKEGLNIIKYRIDWISKASAK